jgi:hypothetical protein
VGLFYQLCRNFDEWNGAYQPHGSSYACRTDIISGTYSYCFGYAFQLPGLFVSGCVCRRDCCNPLSAVSPHCPQWIQIPREVATRGVCAAMFCHMSKHAQHMTVRNHPDSCFGLVPLFAGSTGLRMTGGTHIPPSMSTYLVKHVLQHASKIISTQMFPHPGPGGTSVACAPKCTSLSQRHRRHTTRQSQTIYGSWYCYPPVSHQWKTRLWLISYLCTCKLFSRTCSR